MTFQTLELRDLTRAYGHSVALRSLSLRVPAGQFVALLGPSGCGKSTALNCVAGLLPLTGGSIWLDEQRIDGLPPEKRDFGMVFQNYALLPHLTVRRNTAFGLVMRRLPKATITERVDEALRMVQLTGHADKYPRQLSGGQQQRVAIARAIAMRPRLVLMDEPLSNLDAQLRLDMRAEIQSLHRTLGLTTLYVTHDQEEALALADRLVVLRDGVAQQVGTPQEVYAEPANLYVAGFMGYRNRLPLGVTGVNGSDVQLQGPGMRDLRGRYAGPGAPQPGAAVATFRPDDVTVTGEPEPDHDNRTDNPTDNRIRVTVDTVEYRGRGFSVGARTGAGSRLWFSTERHVAVGHSLDVTIPAARLLVFAEDPSGIAAATTGAGGS